MTMRQGAVGMISALNFREARRLLGIDRVLPTLREAREVAMKLDMDRKFFPRFPEIFASVFSDTIAVATIASDDASSLWLVAHGLAGILRSSALADPPLVYRGAVALGGCTFDSKDQLLLGEAVDEAAKLMERADGAFVCLTPAASEVGVNVWEESIGPGLLVQYPVPLEGGQIIRTKVVNPFYDADGADFQGMHRGYEKTLKSSDVDMVAKAQNTNTFLSYAERLVPRNGLFGRGP